MYDIYDKCSKKMYDTVKQLMKLAEEDNSDSFLELTEANKAFFYSEYSLFETAVAAGLMARNKADILDNFLTAMDIRKFNNTEILSHLAGILIRERRCREAVKCLIGRMLNELSQKTYIMFSAAMADDLEIFKLLYDSMDYKDNKNIMLICGFFKSKKILDHLIDCGNDFLNENLMHKVNLLLFQNNKCDPFILNISLEEEAKKDMMLKWLKNIYSMYSNNQSPEKEYEIIMKLAKNTGLVIDNNCADSISLYQYYKYDPYSYACIKNAIMRELYIMLTYGQKTNELTYFIPYSTPPNQNSINTEYFDILIKIAGDEPFITYGDWLARSDIIAELPEKLKNKLTVKLVSDFNIFDIERLSDTVKLEIDCENPKTVEHLRFLLAPLNISIKEWREDKQKLAKYLIDSGFITVEKMTEIAASVKNNDILNMLFNYGN